jgi:hypothetical protein
MRTKMFWYYLFVILMVSLLLLQGCGPGQSPEDPSGEQEQDLEEEEEEVTVEYIEVVVTGDRLAVRKTPGTKNKPQGDVLERVDKGQVLTLLSKYDNTVDLDGYIWWEVHNPSTNVTGWSASQYLSEWTRQ